MTTDSNVNSTNTQLFAVISDPLTGQTLAAPPQEQAVSIPASFSQILDQEQQAVNNNGAGFTQQFASMTDVDIRRLRLDMAGEIKNHVMAGDRESLKDAQDRYNQCTFELRKRAGILDATAMTTIPLGAVPASGTTIPNTTVPINIPNTATPTPLTQSNATSVPQPSTENIFPEGNPLQLLYQSPYANQPFLYQNQPASISPFSSSNSLITPDQLNNTQILVAPLYNKDLNQLQQSNAHQLQMLQLQIQQGMSGFGGEQQNNSISF